MLCVESLFGGLSVPSRRMVAAGAGTLLALSLATAMAEGTTDGPAGSGDAVCSPAWLAQGDVRRSDTFTVAPAPAAADDAGRASAHAALGTADGDDGPQDAGIQSITQPNDTLFRWRYQRASLQTIGALQAWETSFGSDDVAVAVIADGVEMDHPDLVNKIWRNAGEVPGNGVDDDGNGYVDDTGGWDFGSDDGDPNPVPPAQLDVPAPPSGTAMAGIAAAETNNARGIAGVSWRARIMPLKIVYRAWVPLPGPDPQLDPDGDGGYWGIGGRREYLNQAICYAANNGAQVIVIGGFMLYNRDGASAGLQRMQDAITYARRKGVPVVAGAGECGQAAWFCPDKNAFGVNPPAFPAAFDDVIGVQSFASQYQMRSYASWGDWVDIAAPGEDFSTTWLTADGEYKEINSAFRVPSELAAAHVAGVVAVMRSLNPTLSVWDIEDKLCETANRDLPPLVPAFDGRTAHGYPRNDRFGCGAVDFERAVENMPWVVRVAPNPVEQMIDGTEVSVRSLLSNPHLNQGNWEVASDAAWLTGTPLPQIPGASSLMSLQLDVEAMRRDRGALMAGSSVTPTVVLRAVNRDNPAMQAASPPVKLDLRIRIVERVSRIYLPSVQRRG